MTYTTIIWFHLDSPVGRFAFTPSKYRCLTLFNCFVMIPAITFSLRPLQAHVTIDTDVITAVNSINVYDYTYRQLLSRRNT